jgi:hypothetical protein
MEPIENNKEQIVVRWTKIGNNDKNLTRKIEQRYPRRTVTKQNSFNDLYPLIKPQAHINIKEQTKNIEDSASSHSTSFKGLPQEVHQI